MSNKQKYHQSGKRYTTGELEMDIRLGVYASGKNKGKSHDNGTAIRVSPNKLDRCFNKKNKLL